MKKEAWTLTFDGGASPNPGVGSCAFQAWTDSGTRIEHAWRMTGESRSNNEAEWEAVTVGIETLLSEIDPDTIDKVMVYGDSELVIKQMKGQYHVRNSKLKIYKSRMDRAIAATDISFMFVHIPRELNTEMDEACKMAR